MAEPALNPWAPVIAQIGLGLITIAGSGVVSGMVTYKLNRTKEREEFLRGKLEALFVAVTEFDQEMARSMVLWITVIEGRMSFQEAYDSHEKIVSGQPDHYASMEMLISLYFPQLLSQFQKCREAVNEDTALQLKLRRFVQSGQNPSSLRDPFLAAIKKFDAEIKTPQAEILEHGRKLRLLAKT